MRKIFSLIAAVLFAGSMFAAEYVKVTAAPENWAGEYLIVYEKSETEAFVFNGQDAVNGYAAVTIADGKITSSDLAAYEATIAAMEGGYSVKVGEKYLSGTSGSNALNFTDDAALNTLEYSTDNVLIISNTSVLRFNSASNQMRFRYYKEASYASQKAIQLYKKGEGGVTPPEPACKWDEIAFLGNGSGVAAYTDRFKVCTGDPAPTAVVNIQSPDWAAEPGIYLNFPSADWGAISLAEDQYKIQGAGILLYVSAFLYDAETEVTIVCQEVTYTLTVKNVSPDEKPVAKKTCAEVYALAKNDAVALNDVVVTFVNGKNVWVKDATGAMLLYLSADATWKAGDVLAGVAGTVDIYKGLYEVKPSADQAAAVVATAGEAPAPEELAAIDLDKDMNKYIILKNVAVSGPFASNKLTMTVGENEYELFNKFNSDYAFVAEKKYDIVGIASIYNSLQVLFINATENTATAIDNTVVSEKAIKMFENGQLIIIKNGVKYNALGSVIE